MRSSLLPRRQLRRVCDACKQQRHYASSKSFTRPDAVATPTTAPGRILPSRQITGLRPAVPSIQGDSTKLGNNNNLRSQTRALSSSAASSPREAATAEDNASPAQPEPQQTKQEDKETPRHPTHYDLFPQTLPDGPPPRGRFAIDVRALRREFLTLQATAHPDVSTGRDRRHAEAASARINEAFRTLADPLARAQYVLRLRWGVDAAADETARVEDPGLLAAVLEAREAIEEAAAEADLKGLWEENELRIRESEGRLAEVLEREGKEGREEEEEEEIKELARREVTRLRYWVNVRNAIKDWEEGKPVVLHH